MARHIIYIINPISGTQSKEGLEKLIIQKTNEAGIGFSIFPSVASGDYSFLQATIKEKKVTDIVVAGGDGTISQVVNSLMHADLNFGIIPCGSGNGLAYTAKIPRQPAKALAIIFEGRSSFIDGFTINDRFACMLCGLGFDAQVAYDFAQQPRRGLGTYVKQVVKNFFAAKTYPFQLDIGGKTLDIDAYFISIANSNQYGNNFRIAPKASLSDGLLDIVIVTNQTKVSVLLQTIKQVSGRNRMLKNEAEAMVERKKGVIYFQAPALGIRNRSEAPLHIDGEPAETYKDIGIAIRHKCFRLIQPFI